MSETAPNPPENKPDHKPATRARKPKLGGVVKLSDTGGYALVVGENEIVRLGPAEAHELDTEPVE